MNEDQFKKIEDLMVKAVQSGKQETSDLVDSVIHKLEPAIESAVNKYVNGKLDKMSQKMDDYIKGDLKWKDSVTPSIDTMKMLSNTTSGVSWFLKSVIILGGAVGVVYGLIMWLKK